MKNYAVLGALTAVLVAPAAMAQQAQARGGTAVVVAPAPAVPLTSATFRQMAMVSDAFEIESSRLALTRSRSPRIRRFAQHMIVDHTATSQALMPYGPIVVGPGGGALAGAGVGFAVGGPVGAAVGAGVGAATGGRTAVAAVPSMVAMLDARHAAMLNQLAATSGRRFDALYAQMQVMAHQEAVGLFSAYAQSGGDPALVNFARQVLPTLQMHLAMAQRLARRA